MSEQDTTKLNEYWKQEFNKIEEEYDLARKERRLTKWMNNPEVIERINGLMTLRFTIGMNTFLQATRYNIGRK